LRQQVIRMVCAPLIAVRIFCFYSMTAIDPHTSRVVYRCIRREVGELVCGGISGSHPARKDRHIIRTCRRDFL
jgi:hypothetical protein